MELGFGVLVALFGCEGLKHRPLTVGGVAYALSLGSRV